MGEEAGQSVLLADMTTPRRHKAGHGAMRTFKVPIAFSSHTGVRMGRVWENCHQSCPCCLQCGLDNATAAKDQFLLGNGLLLLAAWLRWSKVYTGLFCFRHRYTHTCLYLASH